MGGCREDGTEGRGRREPLLAPPPAPGPWTRPLALGVWQLQGRPHGFPLWYRFRYPGRQRLLRLSGFGSVVSKTHQR